MFIFENMKAKLTFDLTDVDDITDFRRVNKSNEMAAAIFEFKYNSKSQIQDSHLLKLDQETLIDFIFNRFDEILENHNINIDELIS